MRIFPIFFFLLFPLAVWSQADPGNGSDGACTEATIMGGAAQYDCSTLTISAGTHVFPSNPAPVVRVKVQGNVTIASGAVLNLAGGDGTSDAAGGAPGGIAGPGGEDGGGNAFSPEDAPGASGGLQGISSAATCGGGGGGGGFATAGDNGSACPAPAAGGNGGPFYDITILFRGGFGGGAGGSADLGNPIESGTGGGGGGAIWISAGGNITIDGDIDVRGGNGGAGAAFSGGGGGGSGGAILIQALGDIVNNGTFFYSGGTGAAGSVPGGRGGDGSDGSYEFEDADDIIEGVGTGAVGLGGGKTETFRSSISCGAVRMKNDQMVFQMIAGFMLIVLASRIRGLIRRSV